MFIDADRTILSWIFFYVKVLFMLIIFQIISIFPLHPVQAVKVLVSLTGWAIQVPWDFGWSV